MIARITRTFVLAGGLLALPGVSQAADQLKLAVGAPDNWDTCIPEVGKRAGIFAKHGLELEILYTQGGGETMQAVISGSVDIGVAAGTQAVMGAYAKGAPVRIIWRRQRPGRATFTGTCPPALAASSRSRTPTARLSHIPPTAPRPTSRLLALIEAFQGRGQADRDRRCGSDINAAMSGPDRRRLGVATVRHRINCRTGKSG